jgi:hypothetical protein
VSWENSCTEEHVVIEQSDGNVLLICMKTEWLCSNAEAVEIDMGDVLIYVAGHRAEERSQIQGV